MIRAFQWDLARQVERREVLARLLPRYAEWGYEQLYLHLEDAVHYPSLAGVARHDAYRYEELGELVLQAARAGIQVVPIVNLLGHTQYLIKHPDLRDLNELRDEHGRPRPVGQVCPLHPGTLEVAAKLLEDVAPYCTAGLVHVGLDESFHLGRCPRCRDEVARIGLAAHFAGHVGRLHALAAKRQLQLGLWADMCYFIPEAIPLLPAGVTVYDWYYYPFAKAPRVEFFNFAERDLFPAFKKQGIRYFGCPMNGAFRHEPLPVFGDRLANIRSWWERCGKIGADGLLVTSWEPFRLALETTTVVDAAAAGLWLEPASDDATALLAGGLGRAARIDDARSHARALLAGDAYAFAGYARWQINDRWDVLAGSESLKPYAAELRFFQRMLSSGLAWPRPWSSSLCFRVYLAQRDLFVRKAARDLFRCRKVLRRAGAAAVRPLLRAMQADARVFARALSIGRQAARAMWAATRQRHVAGHNELQVARDGERLKAWRAWLGRAARRPALVAAAAPVAGAWQLQLVVHNFAPAVAKVVAEEQQPDGSWREIAGRHTIEFRASAARRTAKIRREFTAPVTDPNHALRLSVHGVGQVAISQVMLTDGCDAARDSRFRPARKLGRPAPAHGLPNPSAIGEPIVLAFDQTFPAAR